jgi:16S rRNA (cytosine967-C5)-methyltransferase
VLLRAEAADAFVSVLLFRTLEREGLATADRSLATALVLGVLRHRERLDYALARLLRHPLDRLPAAIRTVLRMGAYQLLDLDRIPDAVAVSETVALARRHGHAGTARLTNAVLRRLAAEGPPPPPDPATDPAGHLAVVHSHPRWLLARWIARLGVEETAALAAAHLRAAPSAIRVNRLRTTTAALLDTLRERGIQAAPGLVPDAIRVRGPVSERLPLTDLGLAVIQDEGAMLVSLAVAPSPGQTVIDACAAPGGKTTHLAALMADRGRLLACDVHPRKLQALAARCAPLGIGCVEAHHLDARTIGGRWPGIADAVLVDAPCSGLGTVRRRPEIKWRASQADLAAHAEAQRALLDGASGAVRPGGRLVYSVCSLEPEEGPDVVRDFLARRRDFAPAPLPEMFPRTVGGAPVVGAERGEVFLWPHRHDTDGFYIAVLRRREGMRRG